MIKNFTIQKYQQNPELLIFIQPKQMRVISEYGVKFKLIEARVVRRHEATKMGSINPEIPQSHFGCNHRIMI